MLQSNALIYEHYSAPSNEVRISTQQRGDFTRCWLITSQAWSNTFPSQLSSGISSRGWQISCHSNSACFRYLCHTLPLVSNSYCRFPAAFSPPRHGHKWQLARSNFIQVWGCAWKWVMSLTLFLSFFRLSDTKHIIFNRMKWIRITSSKLVYQPVFSTANDWFGSPH